MTIVAAWIRADTGVGPSMASNNQECNGNWADFAQAPISSAIPIRLSIVESALLALSNTSGKLTEPNVKKISITAIESPKSPTRLTTKAFFAATAADGLYCQKPTSR